MKTTPYIIAEDNHLLVVFKPGGWLSQGDSTGDPTIVDWATEYLRRTYDKKGNIFCGLPHRLDRPVSGAMILCKTSKSLERMNEMFQSKKVSKTYYALVSGRPQLEEATLRHFLLKDEKTRSSRIVRSASAKAKESILRYRLIKVYKEFSLLEVKPETGRPHQIRVQLASLGGAILGDARYGGKSDSDMPGLIALHAAKIEFIHPVKKESVVFEAPLESNRFMEKHGATIS